MSKMYKPYRYFKVLANDLIHNDFKYKLGLNELRTEFKPHGKCSAGGLYICDNTSIPKYTQYGTKLGYVSIPTDAKIYVEDLGKLKVNKLNLYHIIELDEFPLWNDSRFCTAAVNTNGLNLQYVKNQTDELCTSAVMKCGNALKFVITQTSSICYQAVRQRGVSLEFVHPSFQNEFICETAVKYYGYALKFVLNEYKTHKLCLAAVKEDGLALKYVPTEVQTEAICLVAINENQWAMRYVADRFKYLVQDVRK
jgi:hypothetical protein